LHSIRTLPMLERLRIRPLARPGAFRLSAARSTTTRVPALGWPRSSSLGKTTGCMDARAPRNGSQAILFVLERPITLRRNVTGFEAPSHGGA